MDSSTAKFIGTGWKFPVEFNTITGTAQMISGEEQIRNSLDILFSTRMGERIMQPTYGSELDTFLFASIAKNTITYIQAVVGNAILYNEPRIIVNDIEVEPADDEPGVLMIRVDYTISSTNNRYNYVYPFYVKEATNLKK